MDRIGCVAICGVLWEKENAIKNREIFSMDIYEKHIYADSTCYCQPVTTCQQQQYVVVRSFFCVFESVVKTFVAFRRADFFCSVLLWLSQSSCNWYYCSAVFFPCRNSPFCHMSFFMAIRTVRMKISEIHTIIRF